MQQKTNTFIYDDKYKQNGMQMKTISILLAALDEEETIGGVIESLPTDVFREKGYETEIIVVDGHSKDKTREIAKRKGAKILIQPGKGKGDAVRFAFENFNGDYLFMLDADDTYPAEHLLAMLHALETNYCDVIMGSRMSGEREQWAMTKINWLGNKVLSYTANKFFPNGHNVTDVCTGMWGFKAHVPKALELTADGFDIEAEMFAKSVKAEFKVREMPISYKCRCNVTKLGAVKDGARIMGRLFLEKIN